MPRRTRKIDPSVLHGYRSGLETQVADQLVRAGIKAGYETTRVYYTKPARLSRYTPDWVLPNGIVIETKGRFKVDDRQRHLVIKAEHPDLDVRFVFSNSKTRISKASKTTYAAWCEKHGFKYADKFIPDGWLTDPVCKVRLEAVRKATEK